MALRYPVAQVVCAVTAVALVTGCVAQTDREAVSEPAREAVSEPTRALSSAVAAEEQPEWIDASIDGRPASGLPALAVDDLRVWVADYGDADKDYVSVSWTSDDPPGTRIHAMLYENVGGPMGGVGPQWEVTVGADGRCETSFDFNRYTVDTGPYDVAMVAGCPIFIDFERGVWSDRYHGTWYSLYPAPASGRPD